MVEADGGGEQGGRRKKKKGESTKKGRGKKEEGRADIWRKIEERERKRREEREQRERGRRQRGEGERRRRERNVIWRGIEGDDAEERRWIMKVWWKDRKGSRDGRGDRKKRGRGR